MALGQGEGENSIEAATKLHPELGDRSQYYYANNN